MSTTDPVKEPETPAKPLLGATSENEKGADAPPPDDVVEDDSTDETEDDLCDNVPI